MREQIIAIVISRAESDPENEDLSFDFWKNLREDLYHPQTWIKFIDPLVIDREPPLSEIENIIKKAILKERERNKA